MLRMRYFNTTGPCTTSLHYMLEPELRIPALEPYLQQQLYFIVHAARQTGKTTTMRAFAARMRERGVAAVWATLETSQGFTDPQHAEPLWLEALEQASQDQLPPALQSPPSASFLAGAVGNRFNMFLRAWAQRLTIPLVLLLDEADVLSGPALISFLRQLRAGFMGRGVGRFPTSIALIGMRDLCDDLIKSSSLTLRGFTEGEIEALYEQHTQDTGQAFTSDAVARAFFWTRGQPFLVNALARIAVMELTAAQEPITAAHIDAAKERLILSRTTHLDALGQRLREPRVMPILQAVLLGDIPDQIPYRSDDYQYVQDLGLIVYNSNDVEPACPLYREVLARELSYDRQMSFPRPRFRWQHSDGSMDFHALLDAFFAWWRENEEAVLARGVKEYPEAFPHLTLMAFLQRVVNGGGSVHREYSSGRGALDIVVSFQGQRFAVEIKRVFVTGPSAETVKKAGVEQLVEYLDTLNEPQGWLLIFNQRPDARAGTWEQRLWREEVEVSGKKLFLRGG